MTSLRRTRPEWISWAAREENFEAYNPAELESRGHRRGVFA